jgi:CRP-like cAMP-binding protein
MPETDDKVARITREIFIHAAFGALDAELLEEGVGELFAYLASHMEDMRLRPGEVVYREGEPPEYYYFVVKGQVRVAREGLPPWSLGERAILGGIDAIMDRPHARTVTAVTDVHLLRVRTAVWLDLLEDNLAMSRNGLLRVGMSVHALVLELGPGGGYAVPPPPVSLSSVAPAPPAGCDDLIAEPMNLVERIVRLRTSDLFRDAHVQSVALVAEQAEELRFAAGDVVFEGDESRRHVYVVAAGEVEATAAGSTPLRARFGPGTLVCAAATFAEQLSQYKARATVSTIVLRLRIEDIYDVMEEHFDLVRAAFIFLSSERERLLDLRALPSAPMAQAV